MDITKRQITKIAREVSKFTVRTLRDTGIGTGELDVLHTIRKNPGITQASVCRILGIDKGLPARQTASLEGKGYITRQENPEDGRSQLLFAAPQAEVLKNSKAQIEAAFYEWLLEGLNEEQQSEFARLLCILYERCKQESKAEFPHMTERIQKEE
mgnify:FL=1